MDGVALKAVCAGSQIEPTARRVLEKSFRVRGLELARWLGPRSAVRRPQPEGEGADVRFAPLRLS